MTPESSSLGPIAAFLTGMVSFLSPCVLPLVPGYVSFIAGTSMRESATASGKRWTPLLLALIFVLGFATVFIALGATASVISDLLLQYRREEAIVGGLVIMLFGMLMLGFQGFGRVQRDVRWHRDWPGGQPFLAFGLGLAFGFGWTPCIGPVLGAILTNRRYAASAGHFRRQGASCWSPWAPLWSPYSIGSSSRRYSSGLKKACHEDQRTREKDPDPIRNHPLL